MSSVYRTLKEELDNGNKAAVLTRMNGRSGNREFPVYRIILTEKQLSAPTILQNIDATTVNKVQFALETGKLQYFQDSKGISTMIEPYFPQPRLIVLGGARIAKPLVEFASKVGFSVTVVDDKPMFANKDNFPDAEKVICDSFNHCFSQLNLNKYSFAVIVTREHQHDLVCLKQVMNYDTAYIGMIGSKRSVNSVKEQLSQEGYPNELIEKINAPIGLEIGAVTHEEIAISIMAQVISYRRLVFKGEKCMNTTEVNWPELDRTVLEELCKGSGEPKALATIIRTKGSVPRKAGAKMIIWSYGMTVGSIGGGYAEGEVINAAWQIIGSGGSRIHDIDITGRIAEEEGMVCGGVMSVLIEDYNVPK
jgi:xanthine dehydrogenase accessory factor